MTRHIHLDEVASSDGLVVAPDPRAAEAGARALRAGGNAVDAVVAAAFAIGVVEPHMSGVGGGVWMTLALTEPDRVLVVEGPIVAPRAAHSSMFPLVGGSDAVGLYGWPPVVDDANILGPRSVGVPGAVAGLCLAQERFGRLPRKKVLEPAIRLAADGFEVNWFTSALIVQEACNLVRDPGCADLFLPGGLPLRPTGLEPGDLLRQPALARTLELIADRGPDSVYRGELAARIVQFIQAGGGVLASDDLARCEASVHDRPVRGRYGSCTVLGPPATGAPTAIEALQLYEALERRQPSSSPVVLWTRALRAAFADRFRYMSASPTADVPWTSLLSVDYATAVAEAELDDAPLPDPAALAAAGAGVNARSGCTSHLGAVDRSGNLVSLTQTVLDIFGARMLEPDSGILLNDGMMWFDPRPGAANEVVPGSPGLTAVTPLILLGERGPVAAIGAAGGRKVISSTAQLVPPIASGRTAQEAIEAPRLHAESDTAVIDARFDFEAAEALRAAGFEVSQVAEEPTTWNFGRPGAITIREDGVYHGGVDPLKPGGVAAA